MAVGKDGKKVSKETAYVQSGGADAEWSIYEERNFPTILKQWQAAAGYKDDYQGFLQHLGLDDGEISASDLEGLVEGQYTAGRRLIRHLAGRLELEGGDKGTEHALATPTSLRGRAASWLRRYSGAGASATDKLDALEISAEFFKQSRENALLDFVRKLPPITTIETEEEQEETETDAKVETADDALTERLVAVIRDVVAKGARAENAQDMEDEELLEPFEQAHKNGCFSDILTSSGILALMPDDNEAELAAWATRQWGDKGTNISQTSHWQSGAILKFLRQYNHLTQTELGQRATCTVNKWEQGVRRVNPSKLGSLIEALELTRDEAVCFASYVHPELNEELVRKWYAEQNWEHLNHPALNVEWLNDQEESKRAGLLLRSFRQRKGLAQDTLGESVGLTRTMIGSIERGKSNIAPYRLGDFICALELTENDAIRFASYVSPDITSGWVKKWHKAKNWECLNYPAFDTKWLAEQEESEQAGLLLRGLRQHKDMSQEDLGKAVGLTQATIDDYEHSRHQIQGFRLGSFLKSLLPSPKNAWQFSHLVRLELKKSWVEKWYKDQKWEYLNHPALDTKWLDKQPKNRRAGLLLQSYRERKGLSHKALGDAIGVSDESIADWEHRGVKLTVTKLGSLIRELELSEDEAQRFSSHVRSDITAEQIHKYYEAEKWEYLNYPALDSQWLVGQDEARKSGLLLSALMDIAGINREDHLKARLGTVQQNWFVGKCAIAEKHIPAITSFLLEAVGNNRPMELDPLSKEQQALSQAYITDASMQTLDRQIRTSNEPIRVFTREADRKRLAARKAKTQLGSTLPTNDTPELDPDNGQTGPDR